MRHALLTLLAALVVAGAAPALASPLAPAPRAGRIGLEDLRRQGLLRPAPPPRVAPLPAATTHALGEARAFWTYDLSVMPPKNVQMASTCRAVGQTVAVYVADSEWPQKVDASDVTAIVEAFDLDTPLGDGVGISARNVDLFGEPSDIDGDGRLIVFIYAIPSYQGNAFDGFFRAEDLAAFQPGCASNPMLYCSNEAEMVHVGSSNPGSPYMIGVMAHEFQHLLHHIADPNEENWINEAMSELAMSASGYEDTAHLHAYLAHPDAPLETAEFVDYGAVMLWGTWLYERYGAAFVRALVAAPANGRAGLAAAWQAEGLAVTYEASFADWALASVLDGPDALGYALLDLPHVSPSGALPALSEGQAQGPITVPPSSFRWLQGVVAAEGNLLVSIPADAPVGLRVASYVEDASVAALSDEPEEWIVSQAALADPVVVVVANPTLSSQTVTVSFQQLIPSEPEPEPVTEITEPAPDASAPDASALDTSAPDSSADATPPDGAPADDAVPEVGAESEDGVGGGSCTLAPVATPAALPCLLAALGLLLHRRRRS